VCILLRIFLCHHEPFWHPDAVAQRNALRHRNLVAFPESVPLGVVFCRDIALFVQYRVVDLFCLIHGLCENGVRGVHALGDFLCERLLHPLCEHLRHG
jgi:hypothetical protein